MRLRTGDFPFTRLCPDCLQLSLRSAGSVFTWFSRLPNASSSLSRCKLVDSGGVKLLSGLLSMQALLLPSSVFSCFTVPEKLQISSSVPGSCFTFTWSALKLMPVLSAVLPEEPQLPLLPVLEVLGGLTGVWELDKPDDPGDRAEGPGEGFMVLVGCGGRWLPVMYLLSRLSKLLEPASSSWMGGMSGREGRFSGLVTDGMSSMADTDGLVGPRLALAMVAVVGLVGLMVVLCTETTGKGPAWPGLECCL